MTDSNTSSFDLREHARKRPGMYIGGIDARALHQLFFEALDHAIDEAVIGRCDQIWITLLPENQVIIQDNSLGLPIIHVDRENMSIMEAVLERSGIFRDPHGEYEATGSSFGVGLRAVNALSSEMRVENRYNGQLWTKIYHEGLPDGPLQQMASIPESEHGLKLTFAPDFSILEPNPFDFERIVGRCRELAYLIAGLKITIRDERAAPIREETTYAAEGLKTWVTNLNEGHSVLYEPIHIAEDVVLEYRVGSPYTIKIEFACQFTECKESHILSYVNTVFTVGGFHVKGLMAAIVNKFNAKLMYHHLTSEPVLFIWDEIASGLSAVIAIQIPDPQYMSQSQMELMNPEVYGPVATVITKALDMASYEGLEQVFTYLLKCRTSHSPNSAV
ncbi:MAG: hypothetical protein BroJett018_51700 [Chloroflexota bacterium]|nr:hypothetical protein [Chloroflexota bacterium]NOG66029.1 hypothetical protein [Chloroflexota bacterium]GIK67376.1 MAG: hypothetical protein BroJett018_51700 [Chloroflexota bacterium]